MVSTTRHKATKEGIIQRYAGAFEGELGTFKGKVHLELDDSIAPVKVPLRRRPVIVEEKLAKELCRLEQLRIIEKIEQPTDWV